MHSKLGASCKMLYKLCSLAFTLLLPFTLYKKRGRVAIVSAMTRTHANIVEYVKATFGFTTATLLSFITEKSL